MSDTLKQLVQSIIASSFCDKVCFSINTQPRFTICSQHIDHGGYISARNVSPDHNLIFMTYFMSSYHDQASFPLPYLVRTLKRVEVHVCPTSSRLSFFSSILVIWYFDTNNLQLLFFLLKINFVYSSLGKFIYIYYAVCYVFPHITRLLKKYKEM